MNPNIDPRSAAHWRSIFISDVHLGTKDCKAELLNNFLKHHSADQVYIVGDFIDGWRMKDKGIYWQRSYTRVIRRLLKLSKHGTPIFYITGNHDEFLRKWANNRLDNIRLLNRTTHTSQNGKRYLVIHGDQFDGAARVHRLLKFAGDKGYDLLMFLNRSYNRWRQKSGLGYWSLASFIKSRIKRAQIYIEEYEKGAAYAARKQGFDGIICGHIHHAAKKQINGTEYYNTGDWVESCTALVEDQQGEFHLLHWPELIALTEQKTQRPAESNVETRLAQI
jgi:UDP-2,3-diacylglucosamine pyrophosphatase LpxH